MDKQFNEGKNFLLENFLDDILTWDPHSLIRYKQNRDIIQENLQNKFSNLSEYQNYFIPLLEAERFSVVEIGTESQSFPLKNILIKEIINVYGNSFVTFTSQDSLEKLQEKDIVLIKSNQKQIYGIVIKPTDGVGDFQIKIKKRNCSFLVIGKLFGSLTKVGRPI